MTIKMMDGFDPYTKGGKLFRNDNIESETTSVKCDDYTMTIVREGNEWITTIRLASRHEIIMRCGSRPTFMAT